MKEENQNEIWKGDKTGEEGVRGPQEPATFYSTFMV